MSQLIKFDETNLAGIHWTNVYKVCVAVCTSESDAYGSVCVLPAEGQNAVVALLHASREPERDGFL
jgi:hypothetical protein